MAAAVDEEGEVLRGVDQIVHAHDAGEHQHAVPLDGGVAVVKPRDVEEGSRSDQRDDLVKVDRRQVAGDDDWPEVLKIDVPMVAGPLVDL